MGRVCPRPHRGSYHSSYARTHFNASVGHKNRDRKIPPRSTLSACMSNDQNLCEVEKSICFCGYRFPGTNPQISTWNDPFQVQEDTGPEKINDPRSLSVARMRPSSCGRAKRTARTAKTSAEATCVGFPKASHAEERPFL
jgi:hypothetical protein